jgi:hypothetical protein
VKFREKHPKVPHEHEMLDSLEHPFDHLVNQHGAQPHIAAALVQDGADGIRISGELPAVVHHRTDHRLFFA